MHTFFRQIIFRICSILVLFVILCTIRTTTVSAAFGTPTARGIGVEETSDTSLAVNPTANLTAGLVVMVSAITDNASTTDGATTLHSISDSQNNTWIKVFEETETDGAAGDGTTISLWWTKVTTQISTTDTVTLTTSSSVTAKIISVTSVTVSEGNTLASTTGYTAVSHFTSGDPSQALSSLTSREYLFFGFGGGEGADKLKTASAGFTEIFDAWTANSAGASQSIHAAYNVTTATGATFTSTSWAFTNALQSLTGFYEISVPTAALTGTITSGTHEGTIVAGGKTIILTLTNAKWIASGTSFEAQRQNIINGLDSAQAEAAGWDAVVKAGLGVAAVVRTSDTVVTITLTAFASYSITANETVTATIPYTALENALGITASPTFTVTDAVKVSGTTDVTSGTVAAAVDGSLQTGRTGTISGGAWAVYIDPPGASANIITFVDGAATADETSAVITYSGSGDVAGMVLNKHVLSVGATANSSTTVAALINDYDYNNDDDIIFTANTTTLLLDPAGTPQYTDEKIDILSGDTLTVAGTETLTSHHVTINGTLTATGNAVINASGDWTNVSVFNLGTSTVNLTGAGGSEQIISGTNTFYILIATGTSARTIKFPSSVTTTVTNTLTLTGAAGQLLALSPSTPSTTWTIDPPPSNVTVNYINVTYSTTTECINATNSSHSNTSGWNFDVACSTNAAPTAPTSLFTNESAAGAQSGVANAARIGDGTPVYSAVYNDSDAGDVANKYEIIAYSDADCSVGVWDSGASGTAMTNCTQGNRCADIAYGGSALPFDGRTYYWKIRYWDDSGDAGAFSACTDTFTMLGPGGQMLRRKYFSPSGSKSVFGW